MSGARRVSRSVSRHALLVWLAGAMVAALGVVSSDDRAEAYLLLDGGALDYVVPASEAIRWADDVWGPGQTLVREIEDGPDGVLQQEIGDSLLDMHREVGDVRTGVGKLSDRMYQLSDGMTRVETPSETHLVPASNARDPASP